MLHLRTENSHDVFISDVTYNPILWNKSLFFLIKIIVSIYQECLQNTTGIFWRKHRYLVDVAVTRKRTNCKPAEITNVTQYATEPILHTKCNPPEISDWQMSNTVPTTAFSCYHFKVGFQKQYLKLRAKHGSSIYFEN